MSHASEHDACAREMARSGASGLSRFLRGGSSAASMVQAYGRHVGKEVLVASPGRRDCVNCEENFGSVLPRLNDSDRRDMSRIAPHGLVMDCGSEFMCRGGRKK